ncbi:hypothetical protein C4D60_Mb00t15370 [Musa balbisiana]|uniref:NADH:quinone oxidoreductase/Mrp antiporter transmembrane domain-containing protein n=1 Tax=Musa balbisiana TaxID=52838 RepID=A0A4S8I3Z5_MUSBA|nr:hypothetical protein C4D60_Mb00t15370 [Musa balbisiana]
MDSVLYIREEGNQKGKKMSSSFFYHLGAVRDESLMHEVRNPLFDSDSPTPVVAFLSVTSKVAASASATRIFDIPFYFSSNEWHLLLEILAILSMILGNLIAITQTSMKRMLAYSSIGQIGYVIIGIIVGDSNDGYASMITYMLFYISMNLGTFACIVLFGLRTGTDNIRDYAGLYTKDPFLALSSALCLLSLGGLPPLAGFFGKLHLFWCGWQAGLYFLVSIGLLTSVVSIYYYLKIINMILGNLIAITQTSMKRMLAYSSIGQIGYVIIGIIVGDSNDGYASMITYMLFYISMNLGTFACIVLFGLRTGTDNIRDYAGLYTKDPFLALSSALCLLSLGGLPPLAGFFGKLHLFWCGWQAGLYFLVSIGLLTSVVSIYYYLKIIKLLMTGRNQEITPYVRNYRRSPLRSNNSIELSMTVCVIASTIPGISMNPILAIAQDTLF